LRAAVKHTLKNKRLLKGLDTLSFGSFISRRKLKSARKLKGLQTWNPMLNKDLIAL
jgi:hypothetical protein